jgi:hypothetical protein
MGKSSARHCIAPRVTVKARLIAGDAHRRQLHRVASCSCSTAAKVSFVGVNLNFDPTWLFLSLIPGGIGFVLMVYGKKQQRWLHFIFGASFTVYPYFTETVTMMVVVGLALGAGLWIAVRAGY